MPSEAGRTLGARIPDHVVHRSFPEETVVLNIESGTYHGLNCTAGRMFAVLAEADTIGSAAAILAGEFGVSRMRIERDLLELCGALSDRGLLELDDAEAA
jgi:hypothetical protein